MRQYVGWAREARGAAQNSALSEETYKGMLNTAPIWRTSAETAKIRLHGVVKQDREKCPTGRWFHLIRIIDWDGSLIKACREMYDGRPVWYMGKQISKSELDSLLKPRWKWRWRR